MHTIHTTTPWNKYKNRFLAFNTFTHGTKRIECKKNVLNARNLFLYLIHGVETVSTTCAQREPGEEGACAYV